MDVCAQSVKELSQVEWEPYYYHDVVKNERFTKPDDNQLTTSYVHLSTTPVLMQKVWESLHKYIIEDVALHWFQGWAGYTELKFNRYDTNKQLDDHCDHVKSIFDGNRKGVPILTVIGLLNDDFEGGDFFAFEDEKIELKVGSIMVFPANFLFPHRVNPITKGTRFSFVSWVW
jgi:hypothetical protein